MNLSHRLVFILCLLYIQIGVIQHGGDTYAVEPMPDEVLISKNHTDHRKYHILYRELGLAILLTLLLKTQEFAALMLLEFIGQSQTH